MNRIGNNTAIEKINKLNFFLWKNEKIDEPLARLIKKKVEKTQVTKVRNKVGTTLPTPQE